MERQTYSVSEVADMMGSSKNHIYALVAQGKMRGAIHLGGKVLLSKDAIDAMLAGEPVEAPTGTVGY